MTAQEFLRYQLDDLEFQLRACFEPMSEAQLDTSPAEKAYTPRQAIGHLCEAYEAFIARMNLTEWKWGSYSLPYDAKDQALVTLWETRNRAAEAACSSDMDEVHRMAHAYIIAHDAYHVGQLCLVLMQTNPDWDPYSIYSH